MASGKCQETRVLRSGYLWTRRNRRRLGCLENRSLTLMGGPAVLEFEKQVACLFVRMQV